MFRFSFTVLSLETEEKKDWCIMIGYILEEKQFSLRAKTGQIKLAVHAVTTTTISPATLIVANHLSDRNRISKK